MILLGVLVTALGFGGNDKLGSTNQALRALLSGASVPLSAGKHCATARLNAGDKTLGHHVARLLGEMTDKSNRNWLEAECQPAPRSSLEDTCTIIFHALDPAGSAPMASGVSFRINRRTGKLSPGSLSCLSSG